MACRCLRVDQLDAHVLDEEIRSISQNSIDDVINELPVRVGRFFEKIRSEIRVIVEAILWTNRYFRGASPGQEQMDIAYANYSRYRISLHFATTVLLPYLASRISELSGRIDVMRMYRKAEAVFEAISLVHFLQFIRTGGYSTIAESILSLRNWNNHPPTISTINYETQNRELMWTAFRDALLLAHPLTNWVQRQLAKRQVRQRFATSSSSSGEIECVACQRAPVAAMSGVTCRHVACYTCVRMASNRDGNWCPWCADDNGDEEDNRVEMRFFGK